MKVRITVVTINGIEEQVKDVTLDHPRQLTHGTVLDDMVHEFMVETRDHHKAAILNEIRYLSLN